MSLSKISSNLVSGLAVGIRCLHSRSMTGNQMIQFLKYNGNGNDFVIIDNRSGCFNKINDKVPVIKKICNRRFGIGADGLIEVVDHPILDFEMIYYNADGSLAFCGNGARCCVAFCRRLGIIKTNVTEFQGYDGIHKAKVRDLNLIDLQMNDVRDVSICDPHNYILDTGCLHLVRFVKSVTNIDFESIARHIRYDKKFSAFGGISPNFVEVINEDTIKVRTYEKGVEAETLSCGTGSVACAVAYGGYYSNHINNGKILGKNYKLTVMCRGGNVTVSLKGSSSGVFSDIHLIGPATFVFEGMVNLNGYL